MRSSRQRGCLWRGRLTLIGLMLAAQARAQFTADYQTNIISGVISNWIGPYRVDHQHTFLRIDSGGELSDTNGLVDSSGLGPPPHFVSSPNGVLVTDTGSIWSNQHYCYIGETTFGNSLVISNGGQVVATFDGLVGGANGGSNNYVVVTGSGSVWNVAYEMTVGQSGGCSNALVISDGGKVFDVYSRIGDYHGSSNSVVVKDAGSAWSVRDDLYIGYEAYTDCVANSLIIQDQGRVLTSNVDVSSGNAIRMGDGTLSATRQLTIYSNAVLAGCGTINAGTVMNNSGGTILSDCGGQLVFSGTVNNSGTMRATHHGVLESYGTVVNNGTIDLIDGSTNFHGVFINNGTVIDDRDVRVSNLALSVEDVSVQIPSVSGHDYQLQVAQSFAPTNWVDTGGAQSGNDGPLIFTDLGGATNQPSRFYRIHVTTP